MEGKVLHTLAVWTVSRHPDCWILTVTVPLEVGLQFKVLDPVGLCDPLPVSVNPLLRELKGMCTLTCLGDVIIF